MLKVVESLGERYPMSISVFIKTHQVLTFYALTFLVSWGGILLLIGGPGGIPGTSEQVEMLMPFLLLAMFAGPSIAGILLTGLVSGRAGFRELLSRLLRWRVGARWYAVAVLFGPLLVTAVLLALSLLSPEFLPGIIATDDKLTLLLFGIAWGLMGGGFLEELGWTGFAVPRLRLRYNILTTALIVGLMWGAWHYLIAFWTSVSFSGGHSLAIFVAGSLAFYVGALPAYRVLMVWVYDRTKSLLVVMLMHAPLAASQFILLPPMSGMRLVTFDLVFAAALWGVIAVVFMTKRPTRQ